MPEKSQKSIEKPWAVYGNYLGSWGIGSVVKKGEFGERQCLWLKYKEDLSEGMPWDSDYVNVFDSPIKAMAYFLVHQRKDQFHRDKKYVLIQFLSDFPSERANLEKFLAQSQPKCREPGRLVYGLLKVAGFRIHRDGRWNYKR